MDRRRFLKMVGAAGAAVAVPNAENALVKQEGSSSSMNQVRKREEATPAEDSDVGILRFTAFGVEHAVLYFKA